MGRERWGLLCPFRAELGLRLIQCGLVRGLLPYQVSSSSIQSFGHNRHWTKIGGLCPFRGGEAGSPSNTKLPGLRPLGASSRLAKIKMGLKLGSAQFLGRRAGAPSRRGAFSTYCGGLDCGLPLVAFCQHNTNAKMLASTCLYSLCA